MLPGERDTVKLCADEDMKSYFSAGTVFLSGFKKRLVGSARCTRSLDLGSVSIKTLTDPLLEYC